MDDNADPLPSSSAGRARDRLPARHRCRRQIIAAQIASRVAQYWRGCTRAPIVQPEKLSLHRLGEQRQDHRQRSHSDRNREAQPRESACLAGPSPADQPRLQDKPHRTAAAVERPNPASFASQTWPRNPPFLVLAFREQRLYCEYRHFPQLLVPTGVRRRPNSRLMNGNAGGVPIRRLARRRFQFRRVSDRRWPRLSPRGPSQTALKRRFIVAVTLGRLRPFTRRCGRLGIVTNPMIRLPGRSRPCTSTPPSGAVNTDRQTGYPKERRTDRIHAAAWRARGMKHHARQDRAAIPLPHPVAGPVSRKSPTSFLRFAAGGSRMVTGTRVLGPTLPVSSRPCRVVAFRHASGPDLASGPGALRSYTARLRAAPAQ